MKKNISTCICFFIILSCIAQGLNVAVRGNYNHPIKKGNLKTATLVKDIISGYPSSWIQHYVSVELLTESKGIVTKYASKNDTLSMEQKNNLVNLESGNEIIINVYYNVTNAATEKLETRKLTYSASVIPEVEAEYSDGYQKMLQFLQTNAIDKLSKPKFSQFDEANILFTINDQGLIEKAQISKSSGNSKADKLLLKAINKMPRWKPAQNADGLKVKQDFVFTVGKGGC